MSDHRDAALARVQAALDARAAADAEYRAALAAASDAGVTAYAIAKHVGMSAVNVRKLLAKMGR